MKNKKPGTRVRVPGPGSPPHGPKIGERSIRTISDPLSLKIASVIAVSPRITAAISAMAVPIEHPAGTLVSSRSHAVSRGSGTVMDSGERSLVGRNDCRHSSHLWTVNHNRYLMVILVQENIAMIASIFKRTPSRATGIITFQAHPAHSSNVFIHSFCSGADNCFWRSSV